MDSPTPPPSAPAPKSAGAPSRILVPVDFSDASRLGLEYAAMIAEEFHAALDLIYVVEPPVYPAWGYGFLELRDRELREDAAIQLPEFVRNAGVKRSLLREALIRTGEPDLQIVEAARQLQSDWIILASHGLGKLAHRFIGSTTERIAQQAPCPVLTVREESWRQSHPRFLRFRPRRIVVTTDFSDASQSAFNVAVELASRFSAEILLIHVVPESLPADISHLGILLEQKRLIEAARDQLARLKNEQFPNSAPTEVAILHGNVSAEICDFAKSREADLIVIATRGRTGVSHLLLGSVAEKVVRHAGCPVLVVR